MKKRSFSLGEGGIKQLVAEHVEKVIFAGLVLVGLSLIYLAFKHESVSDDYVPKKLIAEAKQARDFIHRESWEENAERFPIDLKVVEEVESKMDEKIDGATYVEVAGKPTIDIQEKLQLNKRTDPALLAPFDLQAKGMFGTITWKKPLKAALNDLPYGSLRELATDSRFKNEEDEVTTPPAVGFDVRPAAGEPGGAGIMTTIPAPIEREMDGVRVKGSDASKVSIPGGYVVCVTALVPFRQQIIEFQALKRTEGYSSTTDYPRYARLEVERMDLDAPKPEFVDVTKLVNMWSDDSATSYPEVCDPDYYDPKIAFPILPFLRGDPTRLAMHPLIPAKKWIDEKGDEEDDGETKPTGTFGATDVPEADGDTKAKATDGKNKMMEMLAGMGPGSEEIVEEVVLEPEDAPEFKLVRFFDVILAPGKRYQYRVRLRLYDPNLPDSLIKRAGGVGTEIAGSDEGGPAGNMMKMEDMMRERGMGQGGPGGGGAMQKLAINVKHGNSRVKESMLDDAVRQRLRDLQASPDFASENENVRYGIATAWSEPSNEIVSPVKMEQYFAGTVTMEREREAKGVKFYQAEPKAELAISVWDSAYSYFLPGFAEVRRGSTLNLKQVVKLIHPVDLTIREIQGRKIRPSGRVREVTYEGYPLNSQAVVIDITGGEKLPNKSRSSTDFYTPSEVLIFDGENFSVQDELEDKRLFRENSLFEIEEEESSTVPGMPGGGLQNAFGGGN